MKPILCGFQVWTAELVDRMAEAGFTHAVVSTYPFNKRVEEVLIACRDRGIKAVVQPPNLAVPATPTEWRYRHKDGSTPSTDERHLWNYAPSIWNPHAARFVRKHLKELRRWAKEQNVPISGLWASVGWEISLPRALGKGADRFRIWTFDDYATEAWDKFSASQEMSAWWMQDVYKKGCATTAWAIKSLVEHTRTLCSWCPGWQPWLPICSPGLNWMDPQSGIGLFQFLWLFYVNEYGGGRTVWVVPALYRKGVHFRPHHVASCSLINRLFRTRAIVGVEGIYGLMKGNMQRARQDGFSGILMDVDHLYESRVPDVKAMVSRWDEVEFIPTPTLRQDFQWTDRKLTIEEEADVQ